ncbi:MAG: type II secretion system protein GspG [Planctomycetota bacterium]
MTEQIQEAIPNGASNIGAVPSGTSNNNVKTSKSAIWSLICGIAGVILCLPAIPAIILGIIGLVKIKKSAGALKGTGMATAGLILGGLIIIALPFVAIVAAIVIPNIVKAKNQAVMSIKNQPLELKAKSDIANIGSALELYKMDSGDYPSSEQGIQVLINNEQENSYINNIPDDPWGGHYQYRYPGENNKDSFDLWSPGADGEDGTTDDVTNWQATSG